MRQLLKVLTIYVCATMMFWIMGCTSHDGELSEEAFLRDSTQYERFQYFDYYTLSGKGEVTDTPYVFVKREKDRITVRLSDSLAQAYIFNKMGDYWHIRQEYDMEYAGQEPCLCINHPDPRRIDRYIKDDTVFQVVQLISNFIESYTRVSIFDGRKKYLISLKDTYETSNNNEIFDYLNNAIKESEFIRGGENEPDTNILVYNLIDDIDSLGIIYNKPPSIKKMPKKGLSMFGKNCKISH